MELQLLERPKDTSFTLTKIEADRFKPEFHYHPEIELTYIIKGKGKRIVGDHIANFNDGDLLLLGSYLPHCWVNEPLTDDVGQGYRSKAIVLQFYPSFLGDSFFESPELKELKQLLSLAKRGIQITGETRDKIVASINDMFTLGPFARIQALLGVLHSVSKETDLLLLASEGFHQYGQNANRKRIHGIYQYIAEHLTSELTVQGAASRAHMSVSSFCHFFKRTTSMKFSEYVSAMRIGYANRLLVESDMTISQICYASGFKTLSYFNKRFKMINGQTPHQFRAKFQEN